MAMSEASSMYDAARHGRVSCSARQEVPGSTVSAIRSPLMLLVPDSDSSS